MNRRDAFRHGPPTIWSSRCHDNIPWLKHGVDERRLKHHTFTSDQVPLCWFLRFKCQSHCATLGIEPRGPLLLQVFGAVWSLDVLPTRKSLHFLGVPGLTRSKKLRTGRGSWQACFMSDVPVPGSAPQRRQRFWCRLRS